MAACGAVVILKLGGVFALGARVPLLPFALKEVARQELRRTGRLCAQFAKFGVNSDDDNDEKYYHDCDLALGLECARAELQGRLTTVKTRQSGPPLSPSSSLSSLLLFGGSWRAIKAEGHSFAVGIHMSRTNATGLGELEAGGGMRGK